MRNKIYLSLRSLQTRKKEKGSPLFQNDKLHWALALAEKLADGLKFNRKTDKNRKILSTNYVDVKM